MVATGVVTMRASFLEHRYKHGLALVSSSEEKIANIKQKQKKELVRLIFVAVWKVATDAHSMSEELCIRLLTVGGIISIKLL